MSPGGQSTTPAPDGDSTPAMNPFNQVFEEYANKLLKRWNAPSVTIAVIDGEDIFAQGFGHATLPEVPATADSLYCTGSNTKAFTAALIDHLIQSKKYPELAKGWDTPISSLIRDDFVLQNEWATEHITLQDAVGHLTGFSSHDMANLSERDGHLWEAKEATRNMRHLPMLMEPRKGFVYSNHMYSVLGHVAETLTGRWLGDLFKMHIWGPLGMNATFMDEDDADAALEDLATSYFWSEEKQAYKSLPLAPVRAVGGAGGIISNVTDYAKWVKCMIHKTVPFSEATHKSIRTPRSIFSADDRTVAHYTLGWIRSTRFNKTAYEHAGSTGTFGSVVFWFPELKYGVVAFSNSFNSALSVTNILAMRLIQDKLNVPANERIDSEARQRTAKEAVVEEAAKAMERLYPNCPQDGKILPPTVNISRLAGRYSHPGYGTFEFVEIEHPDKPDVPVLESPRGDCFFQYKLRLEHVSGDFWLARGLWLHTGTMDRCDAARVTFGIDGNPATIELELRNEGADDGTIVLKRQD